MEQWIETAREAVERSKVVRRELREEAKSMLENGELAAARRIFEDILGNRSRIPTVPSYLRRIRSQFTPNNKCRLQNPAIAVIQKYYADSLFLAFAVRRHHAGAR